jgi:hypothetical protein
MGESGETCCQDLRRWGTAMRMLAAIATSAAMMGTAGTVAAHARAAAAWHSHPAGAATSRVVPAGSPHATMAEGAVSPRARVSFFSATCPATAAIVHSEGTGTVLDFSAKTPAGVPLQGKLLHMQTSGHFYQLAGVSIALRWGSNTYNVSHDATVALSCYGQAKGTNVFYPALRMLDGSATLQVSPSEPGGILTNEGLYGPIAGQQIRHGYTFRVTRVPHATANPESDVIWFANYENQPTGTSTIITQDASLVNVTPYVGPRRGSCRHVHKAILTSTGMRSVGGNQYVQVGTAQYFG